MSWSNIFLTAHFLLTLAIALRVIYSRRSSGAALAWLTLLFAFPFVGVGAYLLIGESKLGRARVARQVELQAFHDEFADRFLPPEAAPVPDMRFRQLARFVRGKSGFAPTGGNSARLLADTDSILQAFTADIEAAQHCCLLEFYIVEGSGRVEAVLEALMRAADRGVRCQLLADSLGSQGFWLSDWPDRLREAGVEVTPALPFGLISSLWVRADLRNHRKILVVDYRIAYTGSYNLVDPKLFKQGAGVGEWVDAVLRCEGVAAQELAAVFYGDWAVENAHNLNATLEYLSGYLDGVPERGADSGRETLQVVPSHPGGDTALVYDVLLNALNVAQERVVISTPYFVPDEALLNTLTMTAQRGVEVVLILPRRNDSRLVRYASSAYYQPLLDAGVKLKMYGGGLLHTKAVVVDGRFALFGTVNMDMRSFYLNLEVSLALYSPESVAAVAALLEGYLKNCEEVELKKWQQRPRIRRFAERCVRLASPLL
ncbi:MULTISPECIES: cardiolipin synthase [Eikenella]|uniref:Cardiolipin synthase n=1 Tax=Eikenella longinqua TaxID=1795827 RepID=A0A1A9RYK7_9NEIS|nr:MULTISPECIES: cardiolipin synthase [Eikenella]OAM29039.1 cardiolipin synthase [Eikenella longinqua]